MDNIIADCFFWLSVFWKKSIDDRRSSQSLQISH